MAGRYRFVSVVSDAVAGWITPEYGREIQEVRARFAWRARWITPEYGREIQDAAIITHRGATPEYGRETQALGAYFPFSVFILSLAFAKSSGESTPKLSDSAVKTAMRPP